MFSALSFFAKFFKALWKLLKPPKPGMATPEDEYHWRLAVAGIIWMGALSMLFHVLWVAGALVYFGLSGYASAQDIDRVFTQLTEQRLATERAELNTLTLIIDGLVDKQCNARRAGNTGQAQTIENQITTYLRQYANAKKPDDPPYLRAMCLL